MRLVRTCFQRTLYGIGLMLAVSGCTALSVSVIEPTPVSDLVEASKKIDVQNYHFAPGDSFTVRFYFNPQLDEDLQVRPDGKVSLSLIGEVPAVGLTPAELSAKITDGYSKYFSKATAVVIVRGFSMQRVFTAGEVRAPGQLNTLTGAQTVLQSIAASGGLTDEADLRRVILVRQLPDQKTPMIAELNLAHALSGEDPSQNVALLPNDLIYVPKSGAADFNLFVHQYLLNNLNLNTTLGATSGLPALH